MNRSILPLLFVSIFVILWPQVNFAECRKIILLEPEENLLDHAKNDVFSDVFTSEILGTPYVGVWDIEKPKNSRNLVGRLKAGAPALLLDKGDKSYKVRSLQSEGGRIVEGWVGKKFARKPDWLDDRTLQKCEH